MSLKFAAGLAFAFCTFASAQEWTVRVDPARSSIQFTLGDVLHTVKGTFQIKSGSIAFNPGDGKAGGQIVVDVKSGDTGGGMRDRRMHKEILQSDRYPEAVFSPDRVTGKLSPEGESRIEVHGVLGIHGQDHEVNLPATVTVKDGQVTAASAFVMPYVSWGMKNPSNFILKVNDTVDLLMTVRGSLQPK